MLFNLKTSTMLVLMGSLSISSFAIPVPVPKALSRRAFVEQAYNDFQVCNIRCLSWYNSRLTSILKDL